MPSQQRFEGQDLEVLIAEVRERFGPDVAIVEANRVRKGGVGGFFAREVYEVVVDADEPTTGHEPALAPASLLDLVDAVDDEFTPFGATAAAPAPRPRTATDAEPLASATTIAELLAKTAAAPEIVAEPVPVAPTTMSTDGDSFADVLERIARASREAPEPGLPADEGAFRSYATIAPRSHDATFVRPTPAPTSLGTPAAATTDRPTDTAVAAPIPSMVVARGRRDRTPARPEDVVLDLALLERLGLPGALCQEVTGASGDLGLDRLGTLLRIAERFPVAPRLPTAGDSVIAVVGDRSGIERTVGWLNEELGLSPDGLVLASRNDGNVFPESRRIASRDEAAARRASWRRRSHPVLVVVDEPVGMRGTTWTRHILDALEPSAVWAAVDAQRKPEDVVEWGERLGGIDAIALDRTHETSSPAALVPTGLPVALLDGAPASPARWAALLDERLAVA